MSIITLGVASLLFTVGTYLVLQRMLSRVIIGLGVISHGANLLIMPLRPCSPRMDRSRSSPIRCRKRWFSPR